MTILLNKLLELLIVVHFEIIKENNYLAFSVISLELTSHLKQSFKPD